MKRLALPALLVLAIIVLSVFAWKILHRPLTPDELVAKFAMEWKSVTDTSDKSNEPVPIEATMTDIKKLGSAGLVAAEKGASSSDENTREASLALLGFLKEKEAAPFLVKVATSGSKDDRLMALSSLKELGPPYGYDQFIDILKHPESRYSSVALEGLTPFHDLKVVPLAIPFLASPYFFTKGDAIRLLASAGGKLAYEALVARRDHLAKESMAERRAKREGSQMELDDLGKAIRSARNNEKGYSVHN